MNTFEGVTQALGAYPPPYSFIMAALTGAAGALEIAKIENVAMAEGGVVTAPTTALIGEGGEPEAVVPLSKASDMGFGGGGGITIKELHVHGVQSAGQFVNQLPQHIPRSNARQGYRTSRT